MPEGYYKRQRISCPSRAKCITPSPGDYGSIEVRRPAGVKQVQLWRTVFLGDLVENRVQARPDRSGGPIAEAAARQRRAQPND